MIQKESSENESIVTGNFSATLAAGHAKDLLKGLLFILKNICPFFFKTL